MTRDAVQVTLTDGICRIVLNRPDKANALTEEMLACLCDQIEGLPPDTKACVLGGAGRVFSAGADLEAARAGLATSPLWERLSGAIASQSCVTIAALNGSCAGGAMGMILACDLRVSVPGAKFFYPVAKLGFLPQPSDPARLRTLVGPGRAKLILLAGAKIGADEALRIGLVDRVAENLDAAIDALLEPARQAAPKHLRAIKAMIG